MRFSSSYKPHFYCLQSFLCFVIYCPTLQEYGSTDETYPLSIRILVQILMFQFFHNNGKSHETVFRDCYTPLHFSIASALLCYRERVLLTAGTSREITKTIRKRHAISGTHHKEKWYKKTGFV